MGDKYTLHMLSLLRERERWEKHTVQREEIERNTLEREIHVISVLI